MHAPHSPLVREQRAPAARVAIFSPPSVCLPLALSVCSAAPRLPATGSARSRPPPARAQSQRAPARLARAAARGPLSSGPSVRRRGPGTQSAAERRGAGYKSLGFRRVYFAPWELHQSWRYDRRLPESCFLCHFLWRPVFATCGFFLLLVSALQGGSNISSCETGKGQSSWTRETCPVGNRQIQIKFTGIKYLLG